MSIKAIIIFSLFSFIINDYELGKLCNEKIILNDDNTLYAEESQTLQGDYKRVFNKVSSCITLNPDKENDICCYIKIKYKLDAAKAHYTHMGCISLDNNYFQNSKNLENYIEGLEDSITNKYKGTDSQLSDVNVDIDCSSKLIKNAVFALLVFLL